MQIKKYRAPKEMFGTPPASLIMYMNASGNAQRPVDLLQSTPVSSPTAQVSIAPTSTTSPTSTTTTTLSTGAAPTAPTVSTSTVPLSSTDLASSSPIRPTGTTTFQNQPVTSPVAPTTVIVLDATAGTARTLSPLAASVVGSIGGGGFGGGGYSEEENTSKIVQTKPKKHFFPWILIATGVFMIVKQPLK